MHQYTYNEKGDKELTADLNADRDFKHLKPINAKPYSDHLGNEKLQVYDIQERWGAESGQNPLWPGNARQQLIPY